MRVVFDGYLHNKYVTSHSDNLSIYAHGTELEIK